MRTFPLQVNRVNISKGNAGLPAITEDSPIAEEEMSDLGVPDSGESNNITNEITSARMLNGIKGIIFDFDGTLFDNTFIGLNLIKAYPIDMFRIRNERLIRRRFAGCDYSSSENYFKAFFIAMGKVCFCSPERIQNWYFNHYMPRMVRVLKNKYLLRPGVQDLFRRFEAPNAMRAAIYSDYPFLKERLEAMGMYPGPKFPLYGPESFGAQKPAVGPMLRIASDLGLPPEEILVIGDREETDGLGAFRAGMRFFCLETGHRYYIPLDPNRAREKEQPQGPELVMYAGTWEHLVDLLMKK